MTATIFNPTNDSLSARIQAWKEVCRANEQMQNSMNVQDSACLDRLGEKQDRLYAQQVISDSYKQAVNSLSKQDLQNALDSKLINKQDYQKIIIAKRTTQSQQRSSSISKQQTKQRSHSR